MFKIDTDKEWEKYGRNDPYFGVITYEKFKNTNLTEENREEFFKSGVIYIDKMIQTIRKHIEPTFTIKEALDFGCGVGRLVIPLADVAKNVTGVDVSDSMLKEAKKNCNAQSIKNVVLFKSDDALSLLKGKYNFIHSFIVFQHIPVKRGESIFKNLIAHLEDEGVCVIHVTYAKDSTIKKLVALIKSFIPLAKNFINLFKGRDFFAPQMQMNSYDLNKLLLIIQNANISEFYAEFTNHAGELGVILFFRKPKQA